MLGSALFVHRRQTVSIDSSATNARHAEVAVPGRLHLLTSPLRLNLIIAHRPASLTSRSQHLERPLAARRPEVRIDHGKFVGGELQIERAAVVAHMFDAS